LLGVDDFTAGFRVEQSNLEGGEAVEVVFRPSVWTWLVLQAEGDEFSHEVNLILTNARIVDWESYGEVLRLVGDTDSFLRHDGPPDDAIAACERLVCSFDDWEHPSTRRGHSSLQSAKRGEDTP